MGFFLRSRQSFGISPVMANIAHCAMLVAWSPMRSMSVVIFSAAETMRRSPATAPPMEIRKSGMSLRFLIFPP